MNLLNGSAIVRARLQMPAVGIWWIDIETAEVDPVNVAGAAALVTLADATFVGRIIAGGEAFGRGRYHIVGGQGGWGTELPPKGYANNAGVKQITIATDAALEAGETIIGASLDSVGIHYGRTAGPGSRVLHRLAPQNWYVNAAGITVIGQRPALPLAIEFTATTVDPARGCVSLALDSLVGVEPGVIVEGVTAVDVEATLEGSRLTAQLWGAQGSAKSRRAIAYRRLFDQVISELKYLAPYRYRVVSMLGELLNLQPMRSSLGLPDLERVPVRPGMAGIKAAITGGSEVVVQFLDADPSYPAVTSFAEAGSTGWGVTELVLGGDSDAVALASLVEAELAIIKSGFDAWIPVAMDGGAALKTAMGGALTGFPASVGSEIVKAE